MDYEKYVAQSDLHAKLFRMIGHSIKNDEEFDVQRFMGLLSDGLDVNYTIGFRDAICDGNFTPLLYSRACANRFAFDSKVDADIANIIGIQKLLIDAGANPLEGNEYKNSFFDYALSDASTGYLQYGKQDVLEYINWLFSSVGKDCISSTTASTFSRVIGNDELTQAFLDSGFRELINKPFDGNCLIHMVTRSNHLKKLIDLGADVNAQKENGGTALIGAVHRNNLDAVELLIARGADVDIKDDLGYSAYDIAVKESKAMRFGTQDPRILELVQVAHQKNELAAMMPSDGKWTDKYLEFIAGDKDVAMKAKEFLESDKLTSIDVARIVVAELERNPKQSQIELKEELYVENEKFNVARNRELDATQAVRKNRKI